MKTESMLPENNIPYSKKERLAMDLGDVSLLLGEDEIVNNLIANVQKE